MFHGESLEDQEQRWAAQKLVNFSAGMDQQDIMIDYAFNNK